MKSVNQNPRANFEARVTRAAQKNGFSLSWQNLRFDGYRAVIVCATWPEFCAAEKFAKRIRGAKVETWVAPDGPGHKVYIYEAASYEAMCSAIEADVQRAEQELMALHQARLA